MLWIALELPSLPLQVAERAGESREPLVISEGPAQRPLVACANAAARAAGVREGQAVAAAKALASGLRVVPRDEKAERETLECLAAWAGQFTPMVSLDGQGIVLEIESTLRLFEGHAKLTGAIRRGLREMGLHATLGIAPTPLAARVFARAEARGLQVRGCIALAELRERLAELPLFLLDWPETTLARLTDLGVLRLRDMMALPAEGIAKRFGPGIVASLDRLAGRIADPREPYAPPARFRSRLELPAEAEGVEALLFPLRPMLAG
ncbi:MAG: Y-family DNA polymerase, partial [Usitatibacter sp.]